MITIHSEKQLKYLRWKEFGSCVIEWVGHKCLYKLVSWVLWHINPCRLFNAKSIFMQMISSISNDLV